MNKSVMIEEPIQITRFNVQRPIKNLWVFAKTDEKYNMMIFICNPKDEICGFIFLNVGTFPNEVYLSKTVCTLNGKRQKPQKGTYTIYCIPLFPFKDSKVEVSFEIEQNIEKNYEEKFLHDFPELGKIPFDMMVSEEFRYYKGDFHGHTIYSDGHQDVLEAAQVLELQNMDFMAFTEHNSLPFGIKQMPCLQIPSFELTLPAGHMNIHGIRNFDKFLLELRSVKTIDMVFAKAVDYFGLQSNISMNHMFMEPWHFTYGDMDMTKVNTIEIICDPTYPSAPLANRKATAFLDFLWQQGLMIFAVGGSDSHNKVEELYEGSVEPSVYGDPSTYVFCKGLSIKNVIYGIKNGHSYVARYGTLEIDICDGKYLPGDLIIEEEEKLTYRILCNAFQDTCLGRFIQNGTIVAEFVIDKEHPEVLYTFANDKESWWLRFGLYTLEGDVIAFVNPVFNKRKMNKNIALKKLLKDFEEIYV